VHKRAKKTKRIITVAAALPLMLTTASCGYSGRATRREMRSNKILIIVLAVLLLGCGAFFLFAPKKSDIALIYIGGQMYRRVELSGVEESYTIPIGEGNVALVEDGSISMLSADCPDKLCVKQGHATVLQPVTCLPNSVTIIVEGAAEGEVDIVIGGGA